MSHFQHGIILDAKPSELHTAPTTPDALHGWWTWDCDVATAVGGAIHGRFGRNHKTMRIELLVPRRQVHWVRHH